MNPKTSLPVEKVHSSHLYLSEAVVYPNTVMNPQCMNLNPRSNNGSDRQRKLLIDVLKSQNKMSFTGIQCSTTLQGFNERKVVNNVTCVLEFLKLKSSTFKIPVQS